MATDARIVETKSAPPPGVTSRTRAFRRFTKNRGALFGTGVLACIVLFTTLGPLLARHAPNTPDYDHGMGPFGTPLGPSAVHWLGTDTIFRDLFARLAHGGRLSLTIALSATLVAMSIGVGVGVVSGFYQGTRVRVDRLAEGLGGAGLMLAGIVAPFSSTAGPRALGFAVYLGLFALLVRVLAAVPRILAYARKLPSGFDRADLVDAMLFVAAVLTLFRRAAERLGDVRFVGVAAAVLVATSLARRKLDSKSGPRQPTLDVDDVFMRAVDVLLAFPFLLLLMAIAASVEHTDAATLVLLLGATSWTWIARIVRGKTLQVRSLDYVTAARALGRGTPGILLRHVVPAIGGLAAVLATQLVAGMIVAEAALSFLGLSVPPPTASWGRMLEEGRTYYAIAPWLVATPAIVIFLAVLALNLVGEGLRDVLDAPSSTSGRGA